MSTKTQTVKNIDLTEKLIAYIMKGKDLPSLPKDVSFVPFSKTDKKLNRANEELLNVLYKEGKPVVVAEEMKTGNGAWKITPANF